VSPGTVERFWPKVDKTSSPDGCWLWTAALSQAGYGAFGAERVNGRNRFVHAHRFAYELLVGPIPEGLQLDHLCRNRACCNPAHLEPVTLRENLMRGNTVAARNSIKTHCKHGHPFDLENTRIDPRTGNRACWTCRRATSAAYNARVSAALNAHKEEAGLARTGPEWGAA
jgi:hypothetical protein